MAHICAVSLACHAEVNFTLVSMGDDVTRSHSIPFLFRRDYKCLGEGNILVITSLLPRIQG